MVTPDGGVSMSWPTPYVEPPEPQRELLPGEQELADAKAAELEAAEATRAELWSAG